MEIKMQSGKRNIYVLLLAISVGSLSGCVANPYGYGVSFINPFTVLTEPKQFDSIIRNFDLQELQSRKPTLGNIHVSLDLSSPLEKATTAKARFYYTRHEGGYGAMTYRVPVLKSDKGTYVLPIPAPEGSHYNLDSISIFISGKDEDDGYIIRLFPTEAGDISKGYSVSNAHGFHFSKAYRPDSLPESATERDTLQIDVEYNGYLTYRIGQASERGQNGW